MKERWIEYAKKDDFDAWAKALSVTPFTARILKNRGVDSIREARRFLYGTIDDIEDVRRLKELDRAVDLLILAVKDRVTICIVNDYDCDGILSGQILYESLRRVGGDVFVTTPGRETDGYGMNKRIIDDASRRGAGLILTCDNGIAAIDEVAYAKSKGLKVVVTDHHEPRVREVNGETVAILPEADSVVDLKRPDETASFRELCGAGVALRFAELLYKKCGVPKEELGRFYEYASIATVADVVPLKSDNRLIVKEGLRRIANTDSKPLRILMETMDLKPDRLNAHTIAFVIAPPLNAISRMSESNLAFRFFNEEDEDALREMAAQIRAMNEERKSLTEDGFRLASEEAAKLPELPGVLAFYLPLVHPAVAGIVAGRMKETWNRPIFLLTDSSEEGVIKGSGRSIDGYHMANALSGVSELLIKFGGHEKAAGLTMKKENFAAFAKAVNDRSGLTERDLALKVMIDGRPPISYLDDSFLKELSLLEPFGEQNDRPLFAGKHFTVTSVRAYRGAKTDVLKLTVSDPTGRCEAVLFGDPEKVLGVIRETYGEAELNRALSGERTAFDLAFTFTPAINEYKGARTLQLTVRNCCHIAEKVV